MSKIFSFHLAQLTQKGTLLALLLCNGLISINVFAQDEQIDAGVDADSDVIETEVELEIQPPNFTYFKSRFKLDQQGQPDLTLQSQCQNGAVLSAAQADAQKALINQTATIQILFEQLHLSSESAPEISREKMHLQGNVKIESSQSIITANDILVNKINQELSATGGVTIESKDAYFTADSLMQDRNNMSSLMVNANFHLFANNANGQAETISIDPQKNTQLKSLSFSTCLGEDKSWQLSSSSMELDQKSGRGEAWNTVLKVGVIPVFYFPYINFPIDDRRQSGLLSPSFKSSDLNGLDISQPFYWNIAPSFDATFIPRSIENRGPQLGSELRWLTQKSYSEFYGEWMENDKLTNPLSTAEPIARWKGKLKHHTDFSPLWSFDINAQKVSDIDYLRDFGSGLQSANETQLTSKANLNYHDNIWNVELFALSNQTLIGRDSYRYLPSLNISANHLADNGLQWQLQSQWSQFEHVDVNQLEGRRINLMPSLSYPMQSSWGFLTPKLSYQSSYYQQQSQLTGETVEISRELPIFSLNSGLHFDRDSNWFSQEYTHSLSPRLFYSYIPYKKQDEINLFDTTQSSFDFNQLWRENRFSGIDRTGDTNHISVALANTFVQNQSGQQTFGFSLGRRYYLQDRQVQLNTEFLDTRETSPWLAQLSFKVSETVDFDSFVEWDQEAEKTYQARNQIKIEPKANHIVNLSHRYRDLSGKISEEIDFSVAWPINDRWRVVTRWYNDVKQDQVIEALAGIEYESCCWAVRLVAQKYLNIQLDSTGTPITIGDEKYNTGLNLQFVFKGLGSAGQAGLSELLESSIRGYKDPFLK